MPNTNRSYATRALREWHVKFGVPLLRTPSIPPPDREALRLKLILEEYEELCAAVSTRDLVEYADALGDLLYVIYGAALEYGIPLDQIFAEVHRSNMTKVWPDGSVKYREDGKVLKPPTYSPADIAGVLMRAGWEGKK